MALSLGDVFHLISIKSHFILRLHPTLLFTEEVHLSFSSYFLDTATHPIVLTVLSALLDVCLHCCH